MNRNRSFACGVVMLYFSVALIGWLFADQFAWKDSIGPAYQSPSFESWRHWLGTDLLGRSIVCKTVMAARGAMTIAAVSASLAVGFGLMFGAAAGFYGGALDWIFNWLAAVVSSVPGVLLLLAFAAAFGRGWLSVCLALALTGWAGVARIVRAEALKQSKCDYVAAASSLGASGWHRLRRHVIPNVAPLAVTVLPMQFASAIKAEVILAFLGLGAQGQPSWGIMLDDARQELFRGVWWQGFAATLAMFFIILALNIWGDQIRDKMDPKSYHDGL